jgi:hypothetical protein
MVLTNRSEIFDEIFGNAINFIYLYIINQISNEMKTWKIELTAPDEQTAVDYLDILVKDFLASAQMKEDMNHCVLEDPQKNERLICNLVKR